MKINKILLKASPYYILTNFEKNEKNKLKVSSKKFLLTAQTLSRTGQYLATKITNFVSIIKFY